MIKDHIRNSSAYRPLGRAMATAMDYLAKTDFLSLAPGEYEIDGRRLFAVVQRKVLKPLADAMWESHHKYIDVQYVAKGNEVMGCVSMETAPPIAIEYDPKTDLVFYKTSGDFVLVREREFAVFTPQDIHAPALKDASRHDDAEVLKVIVKIAVDGTTGLFGG